MTQSMFNPQIGDLGSAATTVAPVTDNSVRMSEQLGLQKKQNTADSFNTFAKGIFDIAPVAMEIAANRYTEKNLMGLDPQSEVESARTKAADDTYRALTAEMDIEKRIVAEDIKSLRGLELARQQGSIGSEEMHLRARQIRASAIDKAPIFADHINAAYRNITGTSTGTSGSIAANPWSMTPEEVAYEDHRKEVAATANLYNTTLENADWILAEDAHRKRLTEMQPRTDDEFALWAGNAALTARIQMDRAIIYHADKNGMFSPEQAGQFRNDLRMWEAQAMQELQSRATQMMEAGVQPSGGAMEAARNQITANTKQMLELLDNNDAAAYVKGLADVSSAKTTLYVNQFFPGLAIAKAAGVDIVKLGELSATNPQFANFLKVNPAFGTQMSLLDMTPQDGMLASFFDAVTPVATGEFVPSPLTSTEAESTGKLADLMNSDPTIGEDVYAMAREAGTVDRVMDAYRLHPGAIVHLKDADLWNTPPSVAEMQLAFEAGAEGVEGSILNKKGARRANFSVWVGKDGKVGMEGAGVDAMTKGQAQDVYETLVANPEVWKESGSPEAYFQELFPNRKFTITGETTGAVKNLQNLDMPTAVKAIDENISTYTTKIEDVEATTEVLNTMLMQASNLPFQERLKMQQKIISLENKLWQEWDKVAAEVLDE